MKNQYQKKAPATITTAQETSSPRPASSTTLLSPVNWRIPPTITNANITSSITKECRLPIELLYYRAYSFRVSTIVAGFTCYVDESGDEGFEFPKGSSPWFILSGVVIRDEHKDKVLSAIDEFNQEFYADKRRDIPLKPPHWAKMKHTARCVYATKINAKPITLFIVAMWKTKFSRAERINKSSHLYRYGLQLIAEKVSWGVYASRGRVKFVCGFSQSVKLEEIRTEMTSAMNSPKWSIRPVFDPSEITIETPLSERMICLADATASSFGNALNPKREGKNKGELQPEYTRYFIPNMFRNYLRRFKYGIKIFPSEPQIIREFRQEYNELFFWY